MKSEHVDKMLEGMPAFRSGKKVQGIGVNDSFHAIGCTVNGKIVTHRAYSAWYSMLARCYSKKVKLAQPTYSGCSVSEEWLSFVIFKKWWVLNYVDGYCLDKDLLHAGNRVYSKERCVYVPIEINSFTTDHKAKRGDLPIGVNFHSQRGKYQASISTVDGRLSLGLFSDPLDAHKAWYKKKIELACGYKDLCDSIHPNLFAGLLRKIESMRVDAL